MAPEDALRSRLEALNRGPLPAPVRAPTAAPPRKPAGPARPAWRAGVVKPLPGLVRRGDVVANDVGAHLAILLPLDELWPGGEQLVAQRRAALTAPGSPNVDRDAADATSPLAEFLAAFPHGVALLDLETCGLAGSALFLAGVLRAVDGRLAVELLLARDYSEEAAVLASLWQRLERIAVIATFNGKTFDWPMVVDRTRRHRLAPAPPAGQPRHVDLLHLARRRWRRELPDCKLQTLERCICGRTRADDVPGSQIPAAYQLFVRTGHEREMDGILFHNAVDLVTMLDLAMRLAGAPA